MSGRKITIYSLREGNDSDDYLATIHMLKSQGIPITEVIDFMQTIKMGNGRLNPAGMGYVAVSPEGKRLNNCIKVAEWILENGLCRLA